MDIPHNPHLDHILEKMVFDNTALKTIADRMGEAMERGVSDNPDAVAKSSLKMLPSFVCALPDGTESGDFMALDLGGTHFRVLIVNLEKGHLDVQQNKKTKIPREIMEGTGEKLFDYVAEFLSNFLKETKEENKKLPLGFTFSFPTKQDSLREAKLINWTKGYKASGVEGENVCKLFQEAVKRRNEGGDDVNLMAIINDTVGTLMSAAQEDPECRVGIIMGTGTNACYLETIDRCPKMKNFMSQRGFDKMILNMEWGAFGDLGELEDIRTEFDVEVDKASINPGRQTFEKMISGMYIGELVRLILLKAVQENLICTNGTWEQLSTRDSIPSRTAGDLIRATAGNPNDAESFVKAREILTKLGAKDPSQTDCTNVVFVCLSVVRRSAELCAAGIAAILNRLKQPKVSVGIDGAVYRYNQPHFDKFLNDRLGALISPPCEYTLKLSEDGSGRGAALVAAVATRMQDSQPKSGAAAAVPAAPGGGAGGGTSKPKTPSAEVPERKDKPLCSMC